MCAHIVNGRLLPLMAIHGFPVHVPIGQHIFFADAGGRALQEQAEVARFAHLHAPVGNVALTVRNPLTPVAAGVLDEDTIFRHNVFGAKLEAALEKMGAAQYIVTSDGTEIEIKESSRGDAYNVYDRRVDRCNSELSKVVLNQTMTIDDGSDMSDVAPPSQPVAGRGSVEKTVGLCFSFARSVDSVLLKLKG